MNQKKVWPSREYSRVGRHCVRRITLSFSEETTVKIDAKRGNLDPLHWIEKLIDEAPVLQEDEQHGNL